MRKLLLLLLFCLANTSVELSAQKIDSLQLIELRAQAEQNDSLGWEAIKDLAEYYYYQGDKPNLIKYTNREIEYSEITNNRKELIIGYYHLILIHQSFSGRDSVFETANFLLDFLEDDTSAFAEKYKVRALTQIGTNFYFDHSNKEQAFLYFNKALDRSKASNDIDSYISSASYLSQLYYESGLFEKAFKIADEAYQLALPTPYATEEPFSFLQLNVRRVKAARKYPESGITDETVFAALKEAATFSRNKGQKKSYTNAIVSIIKHLDDYLPVDTLLRYGEIVTDADNQQIVQDENAYLYHGNTLKKVKRYKEANKMYDIAIEMMKKKSRRWYGPITDALQKKIEINHILGQSELAAANFITFNNYSDSLNLLEKENAIETITAKYNLSKKEIENESLRASTESLAARSRLLTVIGGLLLSLLALGAYFFFRQRQQSKKLEQLNLTKNKIFTILAHDLKGPSLAFENLSKKLSYLIKNGDEKRLMLLANDFEEKGKGLSSMILNVLDWAISEKDNFINRPEKIDIKSFISNVVSDLDYASAPKNIKVNINIPSDESIFFDANILKIVSRNILHNAIKFSQPNAEILVDYDPNTQRLNYTDQAGGIAPDIVKQVLSAIPVESTRGTKDEEGTGIGLATCVKLLKKNNSQLDISTTQNGGTTFSLKFPN